MSVSNFNVAVIGCGYWGPNLIRNFNALQPGCVKTVCDNDPHRLQHVAALYPGLQTTQQLEAIWNDAEIDAVAIATPVRTHFPLAQAALLAGKHVFVEKPMAATLAESRELLALADSQQRTLMVGHTFIFSAPVRRIREIIRAGDLGDILYINSQRLNLGLCQHDINVAWDLAPHDLSIIIYLLDRLPESVNCQGKSYVAKMEDVTNMSLNFGDGRFATIQSSWLDPNKVRRMTIVGSRRMILYDDNEPLEKIRIYDKRIEHPPHYDTFAEFQYSYHYGDLYSPYVRQVEPLKVECQHFCDCCLRGLRCETGGDQGLQVVQILSAASLSLRRNGACIQLDEVDALEAEQRQFDQQTNDVCVPAT